MFYINLERKLSKGSKKSFILFNINLFSVFSCYSTEVNFKLKKNWDYYFCNKTKLYD